MFKSIDLFAGAGGLTEGLARAGFSSELALEFDPQAAETFSFNHPQVPVICQDIATVRAEDVLERTGLKVGELDLLAGGPPCQGFSIAGLRMPNDPKNKMFLEFARLTRELRPRVVLFENVSGIVSMQSGRVVQAIKAAFSDLGYSVTYGVLNAAHFGVPQARPRFILLGMVDGQPSLPEPTHTILNDKQVTLFGDLLPAVTVAQAFGDLPQIHQGEGNEISHHDLDPGNAYQELRRGHRDPGMLFNHRATRHSVAIVERYAMIPQGATNMWVPEHLRTKKANVWRLKEDAPARTVTCNFRTDILHPWEPRGLTVREAARLQSFDDDFQFFGNLTRKAKYLTQDDQVGNAVPPLLAEAIGKHVASMLLTVDGRSLARVSG